MKVVNDVRVRRSVSRAWKKDFAFATVPKVIRQKVLNG